MRRSLISIAILLSVLMLSASDLYTQAYTNISDSTRAFILLDKYDKSARGNKLGNSYFLRGYIYKNYGVRDVASVYYMKALQQYDEESTTAANVMNELGILFLESSSPDVALQYFKKARSVWGDDDYYMAIANLKIGQCYFFKNDMVKALDHYDKSINHANLNYLTKEKDTLVAGDLLRMYEALTEMATLKYNQHFYHQAIKHNEDALIYATNAYDSGRVYNDIGNSMMALEIMDSSKIYFERALESKKKAGVDNMYTYYNLGRYWLAQSDTIQAIELFKTAITKEARTYVDQDLVDTYVQLKKLLYDNGEIATYASYSQELDGILIGHVNAAHDLKQQVDILMMDRSRRLVLQEQKRKENFYRALGILAIALSIIGALVVYILYYRRQLTLRADVAEQLVPPGHEHLKTNMRVLKTGKDEAQDLAEQYKRLWKSEKRKNKNNED